MLKRINNIYIYIYIYIYIKNPKPQNPKTPSL